MPEGERERGVRITIPVLSFMLCVYRYTVLSEWNTLQPLTPPPPPPLIPSSLVFDSRTFFSFVSFFLAPLGLGVEGGERSWCAVSQRMPMASAYVCILCSVYGRRKTQLKETKEMKSTVFPLPKREGCDNGMHYSNEYELREPAAAVAYSRLIISCARPSYFFYYGNPAVLYCTELIVIFSPIVVLSLFARFHL